MNRNPGSLVKSIIGLLGAITFGFSLLAGMLLFAKEASLRVSAAPIEPPAGYPKLTLSTKVVTPTLVGTSGTTLTYTIEIVNTGAYTAGEVTLVDSIPNNTVYNGDAWASAAPEPIFEDGAVKWVAGVVGFDSSVVITFSVNLTDGFDGVVTNTAVINDPMIAEPVTVTAETRVTDNPSFLIEKTAEPRLPGANKPLTYLLTVTNDGQAATNLPITVTDYIPADTSFRDGSPGWELSPTGDQVTWTRPVTMEFGDTTVFTFSVDVDDVPSGTVITNDQYQVVDPLNGSVAGEAYTVTVIDPIFTISKSVWPDPPGSNREMTYTLRLLNQGSLATGLVVTDVVPSGVTYVRGGSESGGVVTWELDSLDTDESAAFTFTAYVEDVAQVEVLNETYGVCSAEGVCEMGNPITNVVQGPQFEVFAEVDPLAKKPGGGPDVGTVTPTLAIHNLGPGYALDAQADIYVERISVSLGDWVVTPSIGILDNGPGCGEKCSRFTWIGNLGDGEAVTFTIPGGRSTIGGEPWTNYTATIVVSDTLGDFVTNPITATDVGTITHFANLVPVKSAPAEVGAGQVMTYNIFVFNSGLSTEDPPMPSLTETVPASVTLLEVSDGGVYSDVEGQTVISWTLPAMGPGDSLNRFFTVEVDPDLVSGSLIVNSDYAVSWVTSDTFSTTYGVPITTVVKEVGLVDSFKTVTPTLALPDEGIVLTYVVNAVNSGPSNLTGVKVYDLLPWEHSTYQRDVVASAGNLSDDIVSINWTGSVAPYSSEQFTFTVIVDDYYEGPVTNTATIKHSSLLTDVVVTAVAYITDDPVLAIRKVASPSPVTEGNELLYSIEVANLGQQATALVVTDTIPVNTQYVEGSASGGGVLVGDTLQWELTVLEPGEKQYLTFRVLVLGGEEITNQSYGVTCAEGISARGDPVVTPVRETKTRVFVPVVFK